MNWQMIGTLIGILTLFVIIFGGIVKYFISKNDKKIEEIFKKIDSIVTNDSEQYKLLTKIDTIIENLQSEVKDVKKSANDLYNQIKILTDKLNNVEKKVIEQYVKKEDFRVLENKIEQINRLQIDIEKLKNELNILK